MSSDDHEGDLSPSQEPILLLGFLFLETDLFLNWDFWMILFRVEAIFATDISKFGNFLPAIDREDSNSSDESISTSLIRKHCLRRKIRTSSHLFFEFYLPIQK